MRISELTRLRHSLNPAELNRDVPRYQSLPISIAKCLTGEETLGRGFRKQRLRNTLSAGN